ncbi:MAG: phage late control D family protein [Magnetospirillum sp.]|nr:MAG: phage late control D family protein [Magnetospirillum sp.]
MKPVWKITADGADITAACARRLLQLAITDEAGIASDTVSITLDNADLAIAPPRKGARLEVWMGYDGGGMVSMGQYVVDETEASGLPHALTIKGKAADMRASFKEQKTRGWDEIAIGDLVATIAGEHTLLPVVSPQLAGILVPNLAQTGESDLNLLTRVAKTYDAVAKPVSGRLLFVPKGEAKSASGKAMPSVALGPGDLRSYRATAAERGKYATVIAHWHNAATGLAEPVRAGSGASPAYTIRHKYPDAAQAQAAASAKLEALARGEGTFSGEVVPGRPGLGAETKITVSGLGPAADGAWVVTRATHTLDKSGGLRTDIEAETPKGEPKD